MRVPKYLSLFLICFVFIITSCNVSFSTNEKNSESINTKAIGFTITLPGNTKSVYSATDAVKYKIDVEKEQILKVSKIGNPGTTITIELDEEGEYCITVFAFDKNDKEIAKGSATKQFTFGCGIIPVKIQMNPYQKTIEIEPIITWNSDPENYVMQTSYSKEGNGIDITITNPNKTHNSIRFFVYREGNEPSDYFCYLNSDVIYPVTFTYPFVEDGVKYHITYYSQTDGREENRDIYTEEHVAVANGGIGEVIPIFNGDNFSFTVTHDEEVFFTNENDDYYRINAKLSYNGTGDEPDLFTTCPLIIEQRGFVEAAKGTNDWGPLSVWKGSSLFNYPEILTDGVDVFVTGISEGDTYFVQALTEFILADSEKYPFYVRTLGFQSENLIW